MKEKRDYLPKPLDGFEFADGFPPNIREGILKELWEFSNKGLSLKPTILETTTGIKVNDMKEKKTAKAVEKVVTYANCPNCKEESALFTRYGKLAIVDYGQFTVHTKCKGCGLEYLAGE